MTNVPPTRSSSPAAVRMRRYRKHRRLGLRSVRILLDQPGIDALIRMKLLKKDQCQDVEALQTAVTGLVYQVQEDLAYVTARAPLMPALSASTGSKSISIKEA
jgi:hypothetical protein